MAFRKLIDGDCGQENPLSQIAGHFTHDVARAEQVHFHQTPLEFQSDLNADQLVQEFMQETMTAPQTFRMDNLLEEMREIENQRHMMGPILGPSVKETLHLEQRIGQPDLIWADEYLNNGSSFNEAVSENGQIWAHPQNDDVKSENFEFGLGPQWAEQYLSEQPQEVAETQPVELDDLANTAGAVAKTLEADPKMQYSKFVKFMQQLGDKEMFIDNGVITRPPLDEEWVKEFTTSAAEGSATDPLALDNTNQNSMEFWKTLEDNWKKLVDEEGEEHPWLPMQEESQDYKFATQNPMSEVTDAMQMGKDRLAAHDIPSAVLCFEAACQTSPENSEAWLMLGMAQAENEQDPLAIIALQQCLRIDPANLKALQALAVSQTNENFQSQACNTLIRWLQNNPKYTNLVPSTILPSYLTSVSSIMSHEQYKAAEDLFIKAVNLNPTEIDSDVQNSLGVLFNLSSEYEKAIDCFRTALQMKPDDAHLWNRLGATLANSGRSEEAVEAYHRALELNPGFIRARYNVGIVCINLKAYTEAAEHFVEALNQQAKYKWPTSEEGVPNDEQRIMSDAVWSTLRLCCNMMGRQDLKHLLDSRDLPRLNQAFGFNRE